MESTPRLALPYLLPNQAQKHLTVNESLQAPDVMTGLSARSRTQAAQPVAPDEGDAYILPAGPTGPDWANFTANNIAAFVDETWIELPPP